MMQVSVPVKQGLLRRVIFCFMLGMLLVNGNIVRFATMLAVSYINNNSHNNISNIVKYN